LPALLHFEPGWLLPRSQVLLFSFVTKHRFVLIVEKGIKPVLTSIIINWVLAAVVIYSCRQEHVEYFLPRW
jgi:hypothetical protein